MLFVVEHVRGRIHKAALEELRALLHFTEEEAKRIELLQRFGEEFRRGFGTTCDGIGSPEVLAAHILSKSPLGAALSILHIEWMTQHDISSVQENVAIDPQFGSLLGHHWLEEAQYAKLDTLMVETIAQDLSAQEIHNGIDGYLAIGGMLGAGFAQHVELDLASFRRATGRTLTDGEAERHRAVQWRSSRQTFLTSGTQHPKFPIRVSAPRRRPCGTPTGKEGRCSKDSRVRLARPRPRSKQSRDAIMNSTQ